VNLHQGKRHKCQVLLNGGGDFSRLASSDRVDRQPHLEPDNSQIIGPMTRLITAHAGGAVE